MNGKPVVHFSEVIVPPVVGGQAIVITVDHHYDHITNGDPVRTSIVQTIGADGSFETRNTHYVRQASE